MKVTLNPGELNVINRFIRSGDIVFDVGAYVGQWSDEVFQQCQGDRFQIHCFEPHPQIYQKLVGNLAPTLATGQVFPNNLDLSNSEEIDILPTLPLRDNTGFFSLGNPDRCLDSR